MIETILEVDVNGVYTLKRHNQPCVCPFRAAVPAQGPLGQMGLMNFNCTSVCPHFIVTDVNLGNGDIERDWSCSAGCSMIAQRVDVFRRDAPKSTIAINP